MTSTVRIATESDLFDLLVLGREFSMEASEMHRWDKDKTELAIINAIRSDTSEIFVLLDDRQNTQGFLFGVLTEPFMSHKKVAMELAWFVTKGFRGNRGSLKLVDAFESWGKSCNATSLIMSDINGVTDLKKFYEKRGYHVVETTYIKEI